METSSRIATKNFDIDCGSNNFKMIAKIAGNYSDIDNVFLSVRTCGNHAENLIELAGTDAVSRTFISRCHVITSLFKMGGYFLRLIIAITAFFNSKPLAFERGLPRDNAFADELEDYILRNHCVYCMASRPSFNFRALILGSLAKRSKMAG